MEELSRYQDVIFIEFNSVDGTNVKFDLNMQNASEKNLVVFWQYRLD